MREKKFDELIARACHDVAKEDAKEFDSVKGENVEFSDNFKLRMNRMFREQAGIKRIPYPEVDTWFERVRSAFVRRILLFRHHHSKSLHNKAESKQ